MRATKENLKKQEDGFVTSFKDGAKQGFSMRAHLNNIRHFKLYQAEGFDSFTEYCKSDRITKRIPQCGQNNINKLASAGQAEMIASNGQKSTTVLFSDNALRVLSTLRLENKDGTRSHEMDVKAIKRVAKKLLALHVDGEMITGSLVKRVIEETLGVKPPKPFGEQLENRLKQMTKFVTAFEGLPNETFLDAQAAYDGVVERLAAKYASAASKLRRTLK